MEQTTPVGDEIFTNATARTSKYTYNFSGALIEEEYPSGRKVKNEFESDGDLLRVTSKKAGSQVYTPYVSNFSYTASGGISQMRLGNGKWETAKFNSRLQVYELGLGNSATNASLWKVNYEYGELNTDGTVNAAKNTGNIAKQTLTIPGASFVQAYKYDSLYRLKEAVEPGSGATANWTQTFDYDRYGNRTAFTQTVGGVTTHNSTPAVSNGVNGTNRFTSTDFEYDKNGNLVGDVDPATSQPRDFAFNADNKQSEVIVNGATVGRYFYDGEGKRVKKVVGDETTVFVYSGGKLVAEYSTDVPAQGNTNYLTTDHLGSPRVITNELGQVKSRRDFMPFGEDMPASIGNRAANTEYTSGDQVRQKFTGYQKDEETKLDFAEARMYDARFGRYTAIDPLLTSGRSTNPQTFNRYVYVGSSPLKRIDPTGLIWLTNDGGKNYIWVDDKDYSSKNGQEKYKGYTIGNGAEYTLKSVYGDMEKYKHLIGSVVRNDIEKGQPILSFVRKADVAPPLNKEDLPPLLAMDPNFVSQSGNQFRNAYLTALVLEGKTGQDILPEYVQGNINIGGGEPAAIITRYGDLVGCVGVNSDLAKTLFIEPVKAAFSGNPQVAFGVSITANKVFHLGRFSRADNLDYAKGLSGGANFSRGFAVNVGVNTSFRPSIGLGGGLGGGVSAGWNACRPTHIPLTDGQRIWE